MTMSWVQDDTSVTPPSMDMEPGEDITIAIDLTALLGGGSASAPTATLQRVDTNAPVTLQDQPSLSGSSVQQRIRGLAAGITYRLREYVTIGGNTEAMTLYIEVGD